MQWQDWRRNETAVLCYPPASDDCRRPYHRVIWCEGIVKTDRAVERTSSEKASSVGTECKRRDYTYICAESEKVRATGEELARTLLTQPAAPSRRGMQAEAFTPWSGDVENFDGVFEAAVQTGDWQS